jgi:hypothetical protein
MFLGLVEALTIGVLGKGILYNASLESFIITVVRSGEKYHRACIKGAFYAPFHVIILLMSNSLWKGGDSLPPPRYAFIFSNCLRTEPVPTNCDRSL